MFGSILNLLASAASAVASWLRGRQQAKDQSDGAALQVAVDTKEVVNVQAAEIAATVATAAGPGTASRMRDGQF